MKQIWGPAWFATALCAIALIGIIFDHAKSMAPAFLFFQISRTIQGLTKRVEELER